MEYPIQYWKDLQFKRSFELKDKKRRNSKAINLKSERKLTSKYSTLDPNNEIQAPKQSTSPSINHLDFQNTQAKRHSPMKRFQ